MVEFNSNVPGVPPGGFLERFAIAARLNAVAAMANDTVPVGQPVNNEATPQPPQDTVPNDEIAKQFTGLAQRAAQFAEYEAAKTTVNGELKDVVSVLKSGEMLKDLSADKRETIIIGMQVLSMADSPESRELARLALQQYGIELSADEITREYLLSEENQNAFDALFMTVKAMKAYTGMGIMLDKM